MNTLTNHKNHEVINKQNAGQNRIECQKARMVGGGGSGNENSATRDYKHAISNDRR